MSNNAPLEEGKRKKRFVLFTIPLGVWDLYYFFEVLCVSEDQLHLKEHGDHIHCYLPIPFAFVSAIRDRGYCEPTPT